MIFFSLKDNRGIEPRFHLDVSAPGFRPLDMPIYGRIVSVPERLMFPIHLNFKNVMQVPLIYCNKVHTAQL